MDLEQLKFPIGKFVKPDRISSAHRDSWMEDIASFPSRLEASIKGLSDVQWNTTYRPGGWTIRQVIHHCADSHMNSLIRFKLTLTEDEPTIKPYFEERWAELPDSLIMPIEPSLKLLEGIHERWTMLLKNLREQDFSRTFIHPEHGKKIRLDENIGIYAWHGNHHLAHIELAKKKV
ncbi:MAG: putative metal-dependent hydrolase [Cytophagaceae bacterium]|jgi:hypothetical protein|nr:putative metal-dependent hydrolase [Cytophagaceae bacterium]